MAGPSGRIDALRNNQLDKVICQLTFQPLFSINSNIDKFQEAVRSEYPVTRMVKDPPVPIAPPVSNYSFSTGDGKWFINLTQSFVSLSTNSYTDWNEFSDRLTWVIRALTGCFDIDTFIRVGLRYINAFRRSRLQGCDAGTPWTDLLNPNILGAVSVYPNAAYNSNATAEMDFGVRKLRVISGIIVFNDDGEQGFLLDMDAFTERQLKLDEVQGELASFNGLCNDALSSFITGRMVEAMR